MRYTQTRKETKVTEMDIIWCNIAIKTCTNGTLLRFGEEIHKNVLSLAQRKDVLTLSHRLIDESVRQSVANYTFVRKSLQRWAATKK